MILYLQLFWIFFKIGAVTFGGGYAMIPLFQQELMSRNWITPDQFTDIVSVAQMTPGAISLNTATYVGSIQGGVLGAVSATLGLVLPGFILSILILKILQPLGSSVHMQRAIRGIRAAAIGLIGSAVLFFVEQSMVTTPFPRSLGSGWSTIAPIWEAILIGVVVFAINYKKRVSPFIIIPVTFLLGVIIF